MEQHFDIATLSSQQAALGKPYVEFVRVPALSAGLYVLPAGARDRQKPHSQDEIYFVVRGMARMKVGAADISVAPGQVIFVPAKQEHRFFDITEELAVLVIFGPAESA